MTSFCFYAPPLDLLTPPPSLMWPLPLPLSPFDLYYTPNPYLLGLNSTKSFFLLQISTFLCLIPSRTTKRTRSSLLSPPPCPSTPCWCLQRRQVAASRTPSSIMIRMCGSQSRAVSVCVTAERFCVMR